MDLMEADGCVICMPARRRSTSALLLDVVVGQRAPVLELLPQS